ncbi:hypothetical protein T12_1528 [Trichinella patagoniensis]|uniref:Uncharacterized protein n=1 Tax=Trichinella patagoniensis TaxID=990121 RepID=A0A0V0Z681_9BILA|nr:hypothetical protein T12_1528 [Trichinella patagoniensis]
METITHFEEFDISNPAGLKEYFERLVLFLDANSIREGPRKLAVLCNVCSLKTYSIIKSLTVTQCPRKHSMKLLEVYQCFLYQRLLKQPDVGVAAYVAELRHLAHHRNFGDTLESRLKDQLVCG